MRPGVEVVLRQLLAGAVASMDDEAVPAAPWRDAALADGEEVLQLGHAPGQSRQRVRTPISSWLTGSSWTLIPTSVALSSSGDSSVSEVIEPLRSALAASLSRLQAATSSPSL